jgi:hypothetical protein
MRMYMYIVHSACMGVAWGGRGRGGVEGGGEGWGCGCVVGVGGLAQLGAWRQRQEAGGPPSAV